jgi:hypothetical protein
MQRTTTMLIIITLLLTSLTAAIAGDVTKTNETLLRATSPFEDLVEYALAKNDGGISKSMTVVDGDAAAVRRVLPAAAVAHYDTMLRALHTAAGAGMHHAAAMDAVELYRLLIDNLEAGNLKVPREVSLLDYAGFKMHVLAAAPQPPDWRAMRRTAEEASGWWSVIRPRVSDRGLRDAFDSTVRGLREAARDADLAMVAFAARIDLDLVDLLESHFSRKK